MKLDNIQPPVLHRGERSWPSSKQEVLLPSSPDQAASDFHDSKRSDVARIPTRRGTWITLLLITVLAAALRFNQIQSAGVSFEDESWYAGDARLWHRCMKTLTDPQALSAVWSGDKRAFQARLEANGVHFEDRYIKPSQGFTVLGSIMMFVVGDNPAALFVTNSVCGVLSIMALYGLGVMLYDCKTALAAAFLLAVSPYHIVYCRSALAEPSATLFVLCGTLFWVAGCQRRISWGKAYFLAGLCFGYAIICHYRSAYIPVLLFLFDWTLGRQTSVTNDSTVSKPDFIRRAALFGGGVMSPILAAEGVFRLAQFAAIITNSYLPIHGFLHYVSHYVILLQERVGVEDGGWNPEVLLRYGEYFRHWHGTPEMILAMIGVAWVVLNKGAKRWPALLIVGTLGILALQRYSVARALAVLIPFLCLCSASLLVRTIACCRLSPHPARFLLGIAAVLIASPGLDQAWSLMVQPSGTPEACAWLNKQKGTAVLPSDTRKYTLYVDTSAISVRTLNSTCEGAPARIALQQLREEGVRWIVTDAQHWHLCDPGQQWHATFEWWEEMRSELDRSAVLVAEFSHVEHHEWEFLAEGWGPQCLPEMLATGGGRLRIYDVQGSRTYNRTAEVPITTSE
ncbi:MAG: glycosyltransferase family 39 protein [Planctomycetota bacterium]